jgi:uncharacterized cupin superfamily protein
MPIATLHTDEGRTQLAPGMCAGFRAHTGNAHNLANETEEDVLYLEIGDRTPGDEVAYADDDLKLVPVGDGRANSLTRTARRINRCARHTR